MGVHLSLKAKSVTSIDVAKVLKATMKKFNRACNTISELSFQQDLRRKYDIHHAAYRLIRAE
jgi:isocitrate/isopropylmalate dehydrogenase